MLSKLYAVSCLATLNTRRVVRGRGTDHPSLHPFPTLPLVPVGGVTKRKGARGPRRWRRVCFI
ncbi:hypothetical protein B0H19DRAFT_1183105 [Mycena capillaripes]|nr:hypothetical protein B0H19DRAFT_1183105 [Mycena capillaripes]